MMQHIQETYKLSSVKDSLTKLYENNAVGITQIKREYIKDNKVKHKSPKKFILVRFKKVEK